MPHVLDRRSFLSLAAGACLLPGAAKAAPPRRLVTVGAPVTEIVYALGAGGKVVGTDTTSTYPAAATATAKVGYMRALSAEGLLSLSPSHVLVQDGSGPEHALRHLADQGVVVVRVSEPDAAAGLPQKIRSIAAAIGRDGEGDALAARIAADFDRLAAERRRSGGLSGDSVLCLIHAGNGGPLAAGEGTVADHLIQLAGGRNALAPMHAYRPLSVEAAIAAAPELLLATAALVDQAGGIDAFLAMPQVAQTPAAAARRVVTVAGELLLGMGPRTPDAVRAILAAGA